MLPLRTSVVAAAVPVPANPPAAVPFAAGAAAADLASASFGSVHLRMASMSLAVTASSPAVSASLTQRCMAPSLGTLPNAAITCKGAPSARK